MKICHQKYTEFFTLGGGGKNAKFHHLNLLGAALRKEGFLEGVLQWGFRERKGSEKGS